MTRPSPQTAKPRAGRTRASFDRPNSAWDRACRTAEQGDPFSCRSEWFFSYHEAFKPHGKLHLRMDSGSGFALTEASLWGQIPVFAPLETMWLFGCPMVGDSAPELLRDFLTEHSQSHLDRSVLLGGLLPGSDLLRDLGRTFARSHVSRQIKPQSLCSASLDGGLDGFLSRRSRSFRRNLRQATRRATDRGVTFERSNPQSAQEASKTYRRMIAVELASWKGIGRCGMAEGGSRQFYQAMLRRLARRGGGRVIFARHADQDIGFIFGGMTESVYRGQQFSFVDTWRSYSIGNLLQIEQIRWLEEEQIPRYDMGPLMDYKHHWTEIEIPIESLLLTPRSM